MITLSTDQVAKIEILDKLFSGLDIEQLNQLLESDLIISKLRSNADDMHFFKDIMANLNSREAEIMSLRSEVTMLKNDLKDVIAAVYKPFDPNASMNFSNLKNKHGIY